MPTLQEVKDYLGVDGVHSDPILLSMLEAAREMVEAVLRFQIAKINPVPELVKQAILYAASQLFSNREGTDIDALNSTLRAMLASLRKEAF